MAGWHPWLIHGAAKSRTRLSDWTELNWTDSLEGLMLKLKLQYFGHLMRRTDSFEKTLILGKIEGRRRRRGQRMRWLDGITYLMDMSLSKLRSWWWIGRPGMLQSMGSQRVGHDWDWTELNWTWSHTTRGSSVQFSHSVLSDSLRLHGLQHARLPCPSLTPRAYSDSCPSSQWYHPTIPPSVVPFSSCLQSFPASGSFPISQFFTSGGQSIGVSASASVLPMNILDWFPLGWTGWK